MVKWIVFLWACGFTWSGVAQSWTATDSLIGYLNPYRSWFDVTHYDLQLRIDPDRQYIKGENTIQFRAVDTSPGVLQLDLAPHFTITAIHSHGQPLSFQQLHTAIWIDWPEMQPGEIATVTVAYQGRPKVARYAPWEGGFVWDQDENGNPWIGVACEGEGSNIWWPGKDHFTDEPDSMRMTFEVPNGLVAVGNGRLVHTRNKDSTTAYTWTVQNPINTYNVSVNIADYVHFTDTFPSQVTEEDLLLSYYVLRYNLEKAQQHFEQVKPMLQCFEQRFGPYPFYEDSYKLIETPYLGMEHQSGIAYGNDYQKGYAGFDQSGLGFDYIIIHESGHEWFGNSITASDLAEVWIHESFTTYSEAVYVECLFGEEKAQRYMNMQRMMVRNKKPIIGPMDVRFDGWTDDNDQYYKGALMLHTLRQAVGNDEQWWSLLHDFSTHFAHQVINTDSVIRFFNDRIQFDVKPFFDQYLRHAQLPVLEYRVSQFGLENPTTSMSFRWKTDEPDFTLPIPVDGKMKMVSTIWTAVEGMENKWSPDDDAMKEYYIRVKRIK